MAASVHASFERVGASGADFDPSGAGEGGSCLAHARRFVAKATAEGRCAALVLGLVRDGARAFPHAWVQVPTSNGAVLELDPTSLAEVFPATHVRLCVADESGCIGAGAIYLDLLAGRRHVRLE